MFFDAKVINKQFKSLLKKIKDFDKIVIYRHEMPDFDAFGTQMGLYYWIKDNFPLKEVHYVGDSHRTFVPDLFPEPQVLDESWYDQNEHLAIVVDTATVDRIADRHIEKAKYVIKLDHHINVNHYANEEIVYDKFAAASELLALFVMAQPRKYIVSQDAARAFYIGIIGDTGRFQYQDVSPMTLRLAADLLATGIDKTEIYNQMYKSSLRQLNFLKFVLNNYKVSEKGTCYYVLTDEDLKRLDIEVTEGKLHINTFRNVEGVTSVVSVTEDKAKGEWRVSLRSAHKVIVNVAQQFNGGGHEYAAGAKLKSLDELPALIKALDEAE